MASYRIYQPVKLNSVSLNSFTSCLFGRLISWCLLFLWWRRRCWLHSGWCLWHRHCCWLGCRLDSWTWVNYPPPFQGFRQLVNLGIVLQQFPGKLLTCEWQDDFDLYWVRIWHEKYKSINLHITMYTQPVMPYGQTQVSRKSHHSPSMRQVLLL